MTEQWNAFRKRLEGTTTSWPKLAMALALLVFIVAVVIIID
jgi:hypothetical protein